MIFTADHKHMLKAISEHNHDIVGKSTLIREGRAYGLDEHSVSELLSDLYRNGYLSRTTLPRRDGHAYGITPYGSDELRRSKTI